MPEHKTLKQVFIIIILLISTVYFSSHTLIGPKSLISLVQLNKGLEKSSEELENLMIYKNTIEKKIKGLNERTLDLDLLDEQSRNVLGYANRNETVIYK